MFSVVSVNLSVWEGGGPHMTTICDAIVQSQVTWDPQYLFKFVNLGPPLLAWHPIHLGTP